LSAVILDGMLLGINAGFGEPVAHEFPALTPLGVRVVRQDVRAHFTDDHLRALVAEFAGAPLAPLFLLAGGQIDTPLGFRVEPHEIAALGTRVVAMAAEAGLTDYLLEVGNEPDLAHVDYRTRPMDFATAVRQTRDAVRAAGHSGPVISGGICNLSRDSLRYLERLCVAGLPDDVVVGFHRYPKGLTPRNAQDGFSSRDQEWQELQRLASGRAVACTEVGHHTAPRRHLLWGFIPVRRRVSDADVAAHVVYDLAYFRERGALLTAVYQLNDGPSDDVHLDRYGIRRRDGTLKPAADAIRDFSSTN
jgi:hypothetical protein